MRSIVVRATPVMRQISDLLSGSYVLRSVMD
jgi:hypothetical protein